ncbi:hypothetical protein VNI00_018739 [Paramarasmius palmivorus]|uniref:Uncharacterized protein n=1 Tax=Paramarasmius palmivorus TaxID=297713 RepID=A0AAW0AUD6_9AGAR
MGSEICFVKFNWAVDVAEILGDEGSQINMYEVAARFGIDMFEPPLASDPVVAARRKRRKEEKKAKQERRAQRLRLRGMAMASATLRPSDKPQDVIDLTNDATYQNPIDLTADIDSDRGPGNDVSMEAPSTTPIGTTFPQDADQSSTSVASRSGSKREAEVIEITDSEQEDGDIDAEAESPLLRQAGRSFVSSHRSTEGLDEWHF